MSEYRMPEPKKVENYSPNDMGEINAEEIGNFSDEIINCIDNSTGNNATKKLLFRFVKYNLMIQNGNNDYNIRNIFDNLYDEIDNKVEHSVVVELLTLCDVEIKTQEAKKKLTISEVADYDNVQTVDFSPEKPIEEVA